MASRWEHFGFAVLRGALKGLPLAGGILEEIVNAWEKERQIAAQAGQELQAQTRAQQPPAIGEAEIERLATGVISTLPKAERTRLATKVQQVAGERNPVRRREAAQSLGSELTGILMRDQRLTHTLNSGAPPRGDHARFAPGSLIADRYRVLEPLGAGGMGAVFRVTDTKLDREVALKVCSPALAADPEFRRRFETEARLVCKLKHPKVVQVYDFVDSDGLLGYVMELIQGKATLYDLIQQGRQDWATTLFVISELCEALDYVHGKGVLHLDLKPANIAVEAVADGKASFKLLDFGLARAMRGDFTKQTNVMGTPAYMPPEQQEGGALGFYSDVYSLGVIAYELAVGRVPQGRFKSPRERGIDIPSGADSAILKAMEADPRDRFQTVRAFFASFQSAAGPTQGSGRAPSPFPYSTRDSSANAPEIPPIHVLNENPHAVEREPVRNGTFEDGFRAGMQAEAPIPGERRGAARPKDQASSFEDGFRSGMEAEAPTCTCSAHALPHIPGYGMCRRRGSAFTPAQVFAYEAVDSKGQKISGRVEATSREEANTKIKQMGLYPTKLVEA